MKKLYSLVTLAVLAVSCSSSDGSDYTDNSNLSKPVMFHCGGDFSLESIEGMNTRSSDALSEAANIFVFDYVDGKLMQEILQKSTDSDFGKPTLNLSHGKHTLYFVISNGVKPVIDHSMHHVMWDVPGDTFQAKYEIEVDDNTPKSETITMNRVASKIVIKVNNGAPENASRFRMYASTWFYSINYTDGRAIHSKEFKYSNNVPTDCRGNNTPIEYAYYTLTEDYSFYTKIHFFFEESDGSIISDASLGIVEIVRNKCCTYTGSFNYDKSSESNNTAFGFDMPVWEYGEYKNW